ncbi:hypothetical protein CAEBREN_25302 [Caenorhabditis brenneri]|uniref:Integrase catalytic domain-containing protein n=1 Tax=Caenorhabditis brenneri TaxID=135651 RepID=G0MC62_CAEBE|nr:hypothetical protein CAEBREN_25302 [Caenorhabditis brenneri]
MATAAAKTPIRSQPRRSTSAGSSPTPKRSSGPPLGGTPQFNRDNSNPMAPAKSVGGFGGFQFPQPDGLAPPPSAGGQLPPSESSGGGRPGAGGKRARSSDALGHVRAGGQLPPNNSSGGGRPGSDGGRRQSVILLDPPANTNNLKTDQQDVKELIFQIHEDMSARMLEIEEQQSMMLNNNMQTEKRSQEVLAQILDQIQLSNTKKQSSESNQERGTKDNAWTRNNSGSTHNNNARNSGNASHGAFEFNDQRGSAENARTENNSGSRQSQDARNSGNTANGGYHSMPEGMYKEPQRPQYYPPRPKVAPESMAGILQVLKPFNGEHADFKTFILQFDHFVHANDDIPVVSKLGILTSLLTGKIKDELAPMGMSEGDYYILRQNLMRQFNNLDYEACRLHDALDAIEFSKSDWKEMESVLNTYCSIIAKLRGLGRHIDDDSYIRSFLAKIPRVIYPRVFKKYYGKSATFQQVSMAAFNAIAELRCSQNLRKDDVGVSKPNEIFVNVTETQNSKSGQQRWNQRAHQYQDKSGGRSKFTAPSKIRPCAYCDSHSHSAFECTIPIAKKLEQVSAKRLCKNCLSDKHLANNCRSKFTCFHCKEKHFTGHCDKKDVHPMRVNTFEVDFYEDNDTELETHISQHHPQNLIHETFVLAGKGEQERILADSYKPPEEPELIELYSITDVESQLPFIQLTTPAGEALIALVDSGAQYSVISEQAAQRLKLKKIGEKWSSFAGFVSSTQQKFIPYYRLEIQDKDGKAWAMQVPSFDQMRTIFREPAFTDEDLEFLKSEGLLIAEITELKEFGGKTIDLLLGNNVLNKVKKLKKIKSYDLPSGRTIEEMLIGYVNYPPALDNQFVPASENLQVNLIEAPEMQFIHTLDSEDIFLSTTGTDSQQKMSTQKLTKLLEQSCSLSILGIEKPEEVKKKDQINADLIKQFKESAVLESDKRIHVKFPMNGREKELKENLPIALSRLRNLYHNQLPTKEAKHQFHKLIMEQLEAGTLEEVTPDMRKDGIISFMPTSVVIKEDSAFTKVRIVNDASAHMKGELSINDCIYAGPSLLNQILGILLRARLGKYLMISDIAKAFHQVKIQKQYRNMTQILWLRDPDIPPTSANVVPYRSTVLPFGISCSPFLLAITIMQYMDIYPNPLNEIILKNMYVDNVIFVTNEKEELTKFYAQAKELFAKNMFMNLREFLVNSADVMDKIPEKDRAPSLLYKLLGHVWNTITDTIRIKLAKPPEEIPTRKQIASWVASNYDPMGLICPVVIQLRLLQSAACEDELKWSQHIGEKRYDMLEKAEAMFDDDLFEIPRQIVTNYEFNSVELVMFSDASKHHYGIAAYLRFAYPDGSFQSKLIFAKSRIKPLRSGPELTIPRMELIALELASNSAVTLAKELHQQLKQVTIFSDSTCTLYWTISKIANNYGSRFVANRVRAIHDNLDTLKKEYNTSATIRYVPTDLNPADIATRGCSVSELKASKLWHQGPDFIHKSEEDWPAKLDGTPADPNEFKEYLIQKGIIPEESDEIKAQRIQINKLTIVEDSKSIVPYERTNSLQKLISIVVRIFEFVHTLKRRLRHKEEKKFESSSLRQYAEAAEQKDEVQKRIIIKKYLIKDHIMDSEVRYGAKLPDDCQPLFQEDGIWKHQRRIDSADDQRITDGMKNPIILIERHPLARLIVIDCHRINKHSGVKDLISEVLREYWMKGLPALARRVRNECFTCRKTHGLPHEYPFTRNLPKERTMLVGPFKNIGIDYFGPLAFKLGQSTGKVWVMLVSCMVTRAIHLEIVPDNSTHGFLQALHRFVSRRGAPEHILSDNAPAFKLGYSMIKKDLITLINTSESLTSFMAQHSITPNLITPFSPWQGGSYERMVALVKNVVFKVLGTTTLPFLELETLLIEVEGILNSRPVTPNKISIDDSPATRPIDFMIPQAKLALPEHCNSIVDIVKNHETEKVTRLLLESTARLKEALWDEFARTYFTTLKNYNIKKYAHSQLTPKVGQVVLVDTPLLPRYKWPLGVITEVTKKKEGRIQSVLVRCKKRIIEKPVNSLIPLEDPDEDDPVDLPKLERTKRVTYSDPAKDTTASSPSGVITSDTTKDDEAQSSESLQPGQKTPPKRGRPPGSKNKKNKKFELPNQGQTPKRGRPPGSKNKKQKRDQQGEISGAATRSKSVNDQDGVQQSVRATTRSKSVTDQDVDRRQKRATTRRKSDNDQDDDSQSVGATTRSKSKVSQRPGSTDVSQRPGASTASQRPGGLSEDGARRQQPPRAAKVCNTAHCVVDGVANLISP